MESSYTNKGLLIYAPSQLMLQEIPKPDGSLSLLYLASALEKNNIPTDILDANIGDGADLKNTLFRFVPQDNGLIKVGMSFEEIANYVHDGDYNFVGINSNFTSQTNMVIKTAKAIKGMNKNVKVFVGGTNARAIYERFLTTGYFDGVCLTEGEVTFPKVVLEGIDYIPGWAYIRDGEIIVNKTTDKCFEKNLDDLPVPSWNKLLNRYDVRDVTAQKDELSSAILTSRGCRFHCAYCHISGKKKDIGKLRLHSLDRTLLEIKELKKLGIKRIYFEDDSLLSNKKRTRELFTAIQKEGLKFLGINGVNLIDFFDKSQEIDGKWVIDIPFIQMLYNAGFYQMAFPLESGSQRIIDKYCSGKIRLNKMDIVALMKVMNVIGIKTPVNIIIGFPDETEEEIQGTIELGKKLSKAGAIYVSFFFATPYPGTELYKIAIEGGHLDEDFDTDLMNWKRPVMKNTVVSPERLSEIQAQANKDANTKEFIQEIEAKTIRKMI